MKQQISYLIIFILISIVGYTQVRNSVSGQINYADEPLSFVLVSSKSSGTVVLADENGRYLIHANIGDTLVFSLIGYSTKELPVTSYELPTVSLVPEPLMLDAVQVVTTTLGRKRPVRELGGGVQVVSSPEIIQISPSNPIVGLIAKVSGLRINVFDSKVDPRVQIVMRGTRSLSGNNSPLYVVDGVPVPSIERLNSNDIDNITVLKGANAAALYGSEGVNGAIMVNTKRGKGKGIVSYTNATSFSEVYMLPEAQTSFGQGKNGVYDPIEYQSWGPAFDGSLRNFGAPLPSGEQLKLAYSPTATDNRKYLFDKGINMQHNLSFSKGGDQSSFFASLQHILIKGIIPRDKSKRTGVRINASQTFGQLRVAYNVNYVYTTNDVTPDGPWVSAYKLPAGLPFSLIREWRDPLSMGNPANFFTNEVKNPFFQIDAYRSWLAQQLFNGKVEAEYTFNPWLKVIYRLGLFSSVDERRRSVERFENIGKRNVLGSVSDRHFNYRRINSDLILNYNKQFGYINTNIVVGNNLQQTYQKKVIFGSNNLMFPHLLNQGSRIGELEGSSEITLYRHAALYAEMVAGYRNYLFLTLSGRNEWVSVLSKENRSFFYPGTNLSFVFSDAMSLLKESKYLTFGKIFVSYNRTGNVNLAPYQLNTSYSQINGFPFGDMYGYVPSSNNPNPSINPEFVTSLEVGTQLSFFNRRLNIDFSYVYSNSDGQIFTALTSAATGYTSTILNAGRLTNNVYELSIGGDLVRTPEFRWTLIGNYTNTVNRVRTLSAGLNRYSVFRQAYAQIGKPFPGLYVADYVRDSQGRIVVDGKTGLPSQSPELTYLGTMIPPHLIGLHSAFSFKGLTLALQFDCRLGSWMYSDIKDIMIQTGTHPVTVQYDRKPFVIPNSVIESDPGVFTPNTDVVALGSDKQTYWNNYVAGYHINSSSKADYLKLRELSISYTLPPGLINKQSLFSNVSLALIGTNLFIVKHKSNDFGDPKSLFNNTAGYQSYKQIPPFRTFGFKVDLSF